MRRNSGVLFLLVVCIVIVGCPIRPPWNTEYQFTSADLRNGSYAWWTWGLTDAAVRETEGTINDGEVREVTEPDVFRRDGNILYVLNQYRGLTLVELNTETVLAQLPTYGFPRDLYIQDNRAYVLVGQSTNYERDGNTVSFSVKARLYVADVSVPASATILSSFDLEGDLVDSRMVGDVVYAVCAEYDWTWVDGVATKEQTSSSWVTSVNVADPANVYEADEVSFGGAGNVIQATPTAIFVASSAQWWNDDATITYVDISDPAGAMTVRGSVAVQGYVADQYKMDAWQGTLRVVTSAWDDQRRVYVTTIDLSDPDNLSVLAEIQLERASGESLFATRFDGAKAYVVTYLVKDPLFVIDLSNPAAPTVAGELEVPGWSTHIEPQGDRLIALGVDDTDGRRVSVSLFNVTDPAAPTLVERVTFGDNWSWSSAYSDVKAFSVFDDLLIVPFSGWTETGGYERLQFISWSSEGLDVRGYVDLTGAAIRSFDHDDNYYGLTAEQLVTIDGSNLDAPEVTNRLVLAEYVDDFLELTPEVGAEIVTRFDTGVTTLRTTSLAKTGGLGEAEVEVGELVESLVYGNSVVLVGAKWENDSYWSGAGHYIVAVVDCSKPEQPEVVSTIKVPVEPYYWWYWPVYTYRPLLEVDKKGTAEKSIAMWPPYPSLHSETVFLQGDTLALRCRADAYDVVLGSGTPSEGLALVNLSSGESPETVGLGYDGIVSLNAANGKLYLSTCQSVESAASDIRPLCAYFLTSIDVAAEPTAGSSVNVPGIFVQYDAGTDLLTVRDDQWMLSWESRSYLHTLRWDGANEIEKLDDVQLPDGTSQVLGRGSKVYIDAYQDGLRLYAAALSPDGTISLGDGLLVTADWGSLLDASAKSAYVSIGGGAIARYDFSSGEGQLEELVPVMGTPTRIRFGTAAAYAAAGYSGVVKLPL